MRLMLDSLVKGVKNVWTNRFLAVIMFLFKFLFSSILLLPLYMIFWGSFARNVKASNFLTWFDISLIIDSIYYWRKILPLYMVMFLLVCCISILAFIFLSGGFWGALRYGFKKPIENSRMEKFFGYCGKYFCGMLKVSLVLGVFYLLALIVFLLFSVLFDSLVGEATLWEMPSWRVLMKFLVGVILFLWVNMIGDYLRISLIQNYGERFFEAIRITFRFVLTNLFKTLSLYYSLSVILAVAVLFYLMLIKAMNTMPQIGFFIFLTFLIQQIFILFTSFYRLVYYSSQLILYDKVLHVRIPVS